MDWSKQVQDTLKVWTDSQKRLLDGAAKMVQQIPTPTTNPWEFSVDVWEKSVTGFLDAEREWLNLWVRGIGAVVNKPEQEAQWSEQAQEITTLTIEYQKLFWESWFFTLKQLDPIKFASKQQELQLLAASWTMNMKQAIELQKEWMAKNNKVAAVASPEAPAEKKKSTSKKASEVSE